MQANSRERIIDCAITLFADRGYTETSMRDIGNAAGIRAATIYNYFPSKKDILEYVIGLYANISQNSIPEITDDFIKETDARTTLHRIFFQFDDDNSLIYKRMLKIFLQEQYRVEEIRVFMKTLYIDSVQLYIKELLDKMVAFEKIAAIDTAMFAEILHSINIKSTITTCHYIDDPQANPNDNWQSALDFVIDLIVCQ